LNTSSANGANEIEAAISFERKNRTEKLNSAFSFRIFQSKINLSKGLHKKKSLVNAAGLSMAAQDKKAAPKPSRKTQK
jgi:hypothetical protein